MRKIKRQQIKETVARVSPWDLCGSSSEIYKNLQDTESYYLKKDNTVIDLYWEWETGHYDDSGEFALVLTRLENDTEYNARVKKLMKIKDKEKSVKEQEEQKELQEYLRLKQNYERAKKLAKEIWLDSDSEGNANDYYYFECGFVAGLNYGDSEKYKSKKKRLEALQKLSDLDQEMGL